MKISLEFWVCIVLAALYALGGDLATAKVLSAAALIISAGVK